MCLTLSWRLWVCNPVTHVSKSLKQPNIQSGLQTPTGTVDAPPSTAHIYTALSFAYLTSKRDGVCNPVTHVSKSLKQPNVSVGVTNPDRHLCKHIKA